LNARLTGSHAFETPHRVSNWFKGVQLITVYLMFLTSLFFDVAATPDGHP
jgi:hypothetical protein